MHSRTLRQVRIKFESAPRPKRAVARGRPGRAHASTATRPPWLAARGPTFSTATPATACPGCRMLCDISPASGACTLVCRGSAFIMVQGHNRPPPAATQATRRAAPRRQCGPWGREEPMAAAERWKKKAAGGVVTPANGARICCSLPIRNRGASAYLVFDC